MRKLPRSSLKMLTLLDHGTDRQLNVKVCSSVLQLLLPQGLYGKRILVSPIEDQAAPPVPSFHLRGTSLPELCSAFKDRRENHSMSEVRCFLPRAVQRPLESAANNSKNLRLSNSRFL